jgi:GTP-binding protein
MVVKEGRGVVIGINKFDLIEDGQNFIKEVRLELEKSLPEIAGAPIVPLSALNGYNVVKIMEWVIQVYSEWQKYIPTSKLNEWLKQALERHPTILVKGRPAKIKYITQAKKRPPTFAIFTNYPDAIKGSYERYLINSLRQYFGLTLTLVRMIIKKSENPFEGVRHKKFSKKTQTKKPRK